MACRLAGSDVELETPLVRAEVGSALRVGIRAGDILLASLQPVGLSARNIIPGRVVSLAQRDVIVVAKVIAEWRWKSTSRWRLAILCSYSRDAKSGWW